MTKNIGVSNAWTAIGKYSQNWSQKMNQALVKMAVMLHGSVLGRVGALPGSPAVNDTYILTTDNAIYCWQPAVVDANDTPPVNDAAQWYKITPTTGDKLYVVDENKFYVFDNLSTWNMFWDPSKSHRSIQREMTFYVPYLLRANATIFSYVASTEIAFPAGAAGSGAFCEVAPSAAVVFSIRKNNAVVGTISFASGNTDGVVAFPSEAVIVPSAQDGMYLRPNVLTVTSPANIAGMQGLNVSLRGKIRSID